MQPTRRQQVLDLLREADAPVTLGVLADRLGVHPNTVRFHVEQLRATGQVEQVPAPRQGPGRPAAHFRVTRKMDPGGTRQYRALAEILASALAATPDRRERAQAAGRAWGAGLAHERTDLPGSSPERLVAVLEEIGFAPRHRRTDRAHEIALRHCPFLEIAQDHADVICPIHLGLMQGALQEWGSDAEAISLQPFREPDLCLARLEHAST